jgi:predicted kinase
MPKAILKDGKITVLKTVADVNDEYRELVNQARNDYLDAQMIYTEQPGEVEKARLTYKEILLRRQNELDQAVE